MVFEINYQKNNNETLFNSLEKFLKLENPQNYIPIYNKYCCIIFRRKGWIIEL